jgi:hypothetical protein
MTKWVRVLFGDLGDGGFELFVGLLFDDERDELLFGEGHVGKDWGAE